jgi:hypothetical protein
MVSKQHETIYKAFLEYLRTSRVPAGLFRDDVTTRIHVPHGHYDLQTPPELEEELQRFSPNGFELRVTGSATTPQGFVVEFSQRIPGGPLYEEMTWVTVEDGKIADIRWYCTGEVHEHRHGVPLEAPQQEAAL